MTYITQFLCDGYSVGIFCLFCCSSWAFFYFFIYGGGWKDAGGGGEGEMGGGRGRYVYFSPYDHQPHTALIRHQIKTAEMVKVIIVDFIFSSVPNTIP